ncbi:ABC transporter [Microbacterium sp.]|uniref:ABC transporter n=1 Tax=Microbacterium sp. TaxID=51671 RepID=UPI0039E325C4
MSDPEVSQSEQPHDVNDVVDSANAGLDAAAAASAAVGGDSDERTETDAVDSDLAAFEAAERDHPGTFSTPALNAVHESAGDDTETRIVPSEPVATVADPTVADALVVEPVTTSPDPVLAPPPVVAPLQQQQPIFVQAPEPPRDRGNRGTAGVIGLLATLSFAILYLGTILGLGALVGDVTGENIADAALAPLTTVGFWTPVVIFFLGFWLLGAVINRGPWGRWVILGIFVGFIAYGGHILGQLLAAPFWSLTASEGVEFVNGQLLAPLAIAAFVFGRELTIWFGAWVARRGARKNEINAEAQREYERTLDAGPTLAR